MRISALFQVKSPEIRALHLTWIAFFITFFVWFNMAPLATTMLRELEFLTKSHLKLFAICNVALTIPGRIAIGMLLDKYGPRRVFSILMVVMAVPTFAFAFGNSTTQLLISRLLLSVVGAGFVVGIHMTALWFKPRDIGFAEGFYAGWGNFGSAAAAMLIPTIAFNAFGGDDGWRYAIASTGVIMAIYGVFYWFAVTDGPNPKKLHKPKKVAAMEVSSYFDMYKYILFTIPLFGILSVLVWKLGKLGFLSGGGLFLAHAVVASVVIYQIIQILRVNLPILKQGVPEDDRYNWNQVASLNTTYFCNFGAELAVVSMLPAFFERTFSLTPTAAGLIAASFAFVNLIARPLGGILSDSMKSRKTIMLIYMIGIAIGFAAMGLIGSAWPLVLAVALTIACSFFVQGAEGATFSVIPTVKRRLTGQISGMAGAYGNVGAVFYLTVLTLVSANQFFFVIGAGAFISFLFCLFFLKEPEGAFAEEYHISSVDKEHMKAAKPLRIMVCLDGSKAGLRGLKHTLEYYSSKKDAEYVIVTVEQEARSTGFEEELMEAGRDRLKEAADIVAKRGFGVKTMLALGRPGEMIIKAIEKNNPDLVVIMKREEYEKDSSFQMSMTAHLGHYAHSHLLVLDRKSLA